MVDELSYAYLSITLKQQIGSHPVGTKFTDALLDLDNGLLTLQWGENHEHEETYEISLVVGARVYPQLTDKGA
jgi:hypothetical protein